MIGNRRPGPRAWFAGAAVAACLLAGCGDGQQAQPPAGTPPVGTTAPAPTSAPEQPVPTGSGSASPKSSKSPNSPATKPGESGDPAPRSEPPTAPATTPVPQPSDGGIKTRVAPKKVVTRPPVPVDEPAEVERDLTVRIERTEAIEAKAILPGEIAGPAVVIELVADNKTSAPVDLSTVVVECTDASKAPCNRISSDPAAPFTGSVAAGATATGRYVFVIPKDQRGTVSLVVTLTGDRPVVVFRGKVG